LPDYESLASIIVKITCTALHIKNITYREKGDIMQHVIA